MRMQGAMTGTAEGKTGLGAASSPPTKVRAATVANDGPFLVLWWRWPTPEPYDAGREVLVAVPKAAVPLGAVLLVWVQCLPQPNLQRTPGCRVTHGLEASRGEYLAAASRRRQRGRRARPVPAADTSTLRLQAAAIESALQL